MSLHRRGLLLAAFCGSTLLVGEASAQDDAVSFVRDLYLREIARHNAGTRVADGEFLSVFSREAQRIWVAARDNRNPPAAPVGPVTHAFFGPGVPPGRDVKFVRVGVAGGGARLLAVFVDLLIDGQGRKLHAYVVREGGSWRVDDVVYDPRESFVTYHRRRAGM
jgi:hypothetical protein